jgi:hypothetical protein
LMGTLSHTIAPHWDMNLSLTFFWRTRPAKLWHLCDTIHHTTDD